MWVEEIRQSRCALERLLLTRALTLRDLYRWTTGWQRSNAFSVEDNEIYTTSHAKTYDFFLNILKRPIVHWCSKNSKWKGNHDLRFQSIIMVIAYFMASKFHFGIKIISVAYFFVVNAHTFGLLQKPLCCGEVVTCKNNPV